MKTIAPYGTWSSPLSARRVASGSLGLTEPGIDGEDLYWIEGRPAEQGRQVLVRCRGDGVIEDAVPAGFNVRTRVHQYGGGAYAVHQGTVYFSNFTDNRLYRIAAGGVPEALTLDPQLYFADAIVDTDRNRLICVREDHRLEGREEINALVAVPLDAPNDGEMLVSGADFYSNPRLSPDGRQLAWLQWSHPDMPWDGTELWVAPVRGDGRLGVAQRIAGGDEESIVQPEWSPGGVLHFVSDRSDWWNLYRWREGRAEALCPMDAEFAHPQWVLGTRSYAFISPDEILCSFTQAGAWKLARLDTQRGALQALQLRHQPEDGLCASPGAALIVGAAADAPRAVLRLDLGSNEVQILRQSFDQVPDAADISLPRAIEFPADQGRTAHAWYYAPANARYEAPADEHPPLIVNSHGGPTSAAAGTLSLKVQYWTSRGFAVVDVNYGGSTGYGRAYRQRLDRKWGVVDVEDCIAAAQFLVREGKADDKRLIIHGGSAGGYTTLAALTFHHVFSAGASYYGVSDAEALARDTHKFESRYMDRLIGPYPEARTLYQERSPIHHVERLATPLILFQGLDDKVVPPSQSEAMASALRDKGLPVAYVAFEGEGHGFRRAENIVRALEAELYFYGAVLGFRPADEIEAVGIDNL